MKGRNLIELKNTAQAFTGPVLHHLCEEFGIKGTVCKMFCKHYMEGGCENPDSFAQGYCQEGFLPDLPTREGIKQRLISHCPGKSKELLREMLAA